MDAWVWIVIIAAVLIVLAAAYWLMQNRKRTELRESFGPEYDRTVGEADSRREAESELRERQERREKLDIRPLTDATRDRYSERWRETQARFVDDPGSAVGDADSLVQEVMSERGYPTHDFEQRAADVSVDHPDVVENYRAAHNIAQAHERGEASTEDLRQSLVHYRSLFEVLLVTSPEKEEVEA